MNCISLKIGLDIRVTHCAGHLSANARPHQLHWGDREMESAFSCTEYCQVAAPYSDDMTLQLLEKRALTV